MPSQARIIVCALALIALPLGGICTPEGVCDSATGDCHNDRPKTLAKAMTLCLKVLLPKGVAKLGSPFSNKRKASGCIELPEGWGTSSETPRDDDPWLPAELTRVLGLSDKHVVRGVTEMKGGPILPMRLALSMAAVASFKGNKAPKYKLVLYGKEQPKRVRNKAHTAVTAVEKSPILDMESTNNEKMTNDQLQFLGVTVAKALWQTGIARVKVGSDRLERFKIAYREGTDAMDTLALQPQLALDAFIRSPEDNKFSGYNQDTTGIKYFQHRRAYHRGVTYVGRGDKSKAKSLPDKGPKSAPMRIPYGKIEELPKKLQESFDNLYDDLDTIAMTMLFFIGRGIGKNDTEAVTFATDLIHTDEHGSAKNPLSDSYFRLFHYDTGDGPCFGKAHADVGGVTVAPTSEVDGLQMLLPNPIQVSSSKSKVPTIEQWDWVPVEKIMKERVESGESTEDEWIIFVGEALARSAGLHPVIHRVCQSESTPAKEDRISIPFFQRPAPMSPVHNFKNKKDTKDTIPMRFFFQDLKERIYNKFDISQIVK